MKGAMTAKQGQRAPLHQSLHNTSEGAPAPAIFKDRPMLSLVEA
jgi:hypothetical protein